MHTIAVPLQVNVSYNGDLILNQDQGTILGRLHALSARLLKVVINMHDT